MNVSLLKKYIAYYKSLFEGKVYNETEHLQERARRIEFYKGFTKTKIQAISYEDFTKYIGTLWASSMYGSKKYLVDKIISSNGGLESIATKLAEFVYGSAPIEERWDTFMGEAVMFGPSYLSEILSYYYPDDYVISNGQVIKALAILDGEEPAKYSNKMTGARYLRICEAIKEIALIMKEEGLVVENLLSVDYLLWEIAKAEPIEQDPAPEESKTKKKAVGVSEHSEIIQKIIDIGVCLGFEAEKEVKVAHGAIVDAVWKVRIGNMGVIMYVFEVQSHGSIDSLILNLQKASNNKAVQRLIAVSDTKQLQQIKDEVAPLKTVDLVLWDFSDVRAVHESLSSAFESINKLGLVPPDFNN